MSEVSTMNIYQRMAAITFELQTVAKNLNVDTGRGKGYKAVGERDVIDAVKPLESRYGVYSYPFSRETLESYTVEKESQYGVTRSYYVRLKTVYRFVNIDKPEEFIETTVFSVGLDTQDKGDGKAMTYADKYALMKAYKISTGDDPDKDPSPEEDDISKKMKRPEKGPVEVCESCGKPISGSVGKDGTPLSSADVAQYTEKKFGKKLCTACAKEEDMRRKEAARKNTKNMDEV